MATPVDESTSSLEKWLQKELSKLLGGAPVGNDQLKYILSMGSVDEVEDYISDLGGEDNSKRKEFITKLHRRWCQMGTPVTPPTTSTSSMGGVSRKLAPPPGLERRPQNMCAEAIQHCMSSGSEAKAGATSKGDPPQGGITEGDTPLGATPKGDPPPGMAAKGNPLHTQANAYMKPKQGDLAYVPASATQKRETQQKGSGGHYPSRHPQANSSCHKLRNGVNIAENHKGNSQKKQKYVTLTSSEGQTRMTMCFPGRHTCECLAQKHALVNNCTECGRIVCVQEGVGPCVTCGALVCTPEEQALLSRDSKKASKLRESLMKQYNVQIQSGAVMEGLKDPQSKLAESRDTLCKAVDHKEKLLEFDRTSTRQTKVIDDESDYFSTESNRWISDAKRKALQQREAELREIRHGSRMNRKLLVELDFAGRRVVEEEQVNDMYDERHVANLLSSGGQQTFYTPPAQNMEVDKDSLVNPTIEVHPPQYTPVADVGKKYSKDSNVNMTGPLVMRIQDRPLQEMRDEGMCLSMHQPWASLLVLGVKKVEGRTWYTPHRGRLWIASAKYMPDGEEIAAVEQQYRDLYNEPDLAFPHDYPSGELLGAVDVVDCLTQEDFQAQYRSSESQSPYVMIVNNPQRLHRNIPVQGQHKIWQLPSDVHTQAKKLIQASTNRTSSGNTIN